MSCENCKHYLWEGGIVMIPACEYGLAVLVMNNNCEYYEKEGL